MQIQRPVVTIGWLLAVAIALVAFLGLISVVPMSAPVVFGCILGLAVARLL